MESGDEDPWPDDGPRHQYAHVVLKDVQGQAILPIWVGVYEANAIALEIEKVQTPRPMTTIC